MKRHLKLALDLWLQAGLRQIGQVSILQIVPASFVLTHCEDHSASEFELFTDPLAARHLATYDDQGLFRPLKTAPNLRRGWKLLLPDLDSLLTALESFYPAMLGSFLSFQQHELLPVSLRETLGRQSGMYAVTRKLTDDQAQSIIAQQCGPGCLKTLLWPISSDLPILSLPQAKLIPTHFPDPSGCLPLLCSEACNLLVAKAREVIKSAPAHE